MRIIERKKERFFWSNLVKKWKVYRSAENFHNSEVDRDIPPQAPTGHSMASIVQGL